MKKEFNLMVQTFKEFTKKNLDDSTILKIISGLGVQALRILQNSAEIIPQGAIADKQYSVFKINNPQRYSRPFRPDLFIYEPKEFIKSWNSMLLSIDSKKARIDFPDVDLVIYTALQAFACSFDLYQPGSRKTPGTFYEILIGALLSLTTGLKRVKQVAIPNEKYKVPTDIVLEPEAETGISLVIPTKITTRERIVQPWAHQRILDDVFGEVTYKTILVCISELQRDGEVGVNEICVPNQVGLFQAHLAKISGMYYADPPTVYTKASFIDLPVRTLCNLFREDLGKLLGRR